METVAATSRQALRRRIVGKHVTDLVAGCDGKSPKRLVSIFNSISKRAPSLLRVLLEQYHRDLAMSSNGIAILGAGIFAKEGP